MLLPNRPSAALLCDLQDVHFDCLCRVHAEDNPLRDVLSKHRSHDQGVPALLQKASREGLVGWVHPREQLVCQGTTKCLFQ